MTDDGLLADLRAALGDARVLARPIDRAAYASDASCYRIVPRAVVRPDTIEDVRALLATCRAHRTGVTFRAAGTSLSGQAVGPGVVVDLSRGWKRLEVLDAGARVRAGPGVIGGRVNAALRAHGRRIGPDPASIDACMLGGIVANDASGMCCGLEESAYRTLESLVVVLADGAVIDTGRPDAPDALRALAPRIALGLTALRARALADPALRATIERKARIKCTTGYALRALLEHDEPVRMLERLLVGSEGTLGFLAEVVLRTVPDPPHRLVALLAFASVPAAAAAVEPLAAAGARAVELMDRACLRAVEGRPGVPPDLASLGPEGAALLCEWQVEREADLDFARRVATREAARLPLALPPRLVTDAAQRHALWTVRKGIFPSVGASRPPGTAIIIEDIAVPRARLAAAVADLQALLAAHGYAGAGVFGHARDGNLHFVLAQGFSTDADIARYARFMDALVDLIALRHEGSLKAEHGTGRNMAPFVAAEWGEPATALMADLKALLDPDGVLNPGVLLPMTPRSHLQDLKSLPPVEDEVDRCIECGFCEPACPSRALTLSPRQRIVIRRERARARSIDSARPWSLAELEVDWPRDGLETCAVDGLCAMACPVGIDTGALVRRLRAEGHDASARRRAVHVARRLQLAERLARGALALGHGIEARAPGALARATRGASALAERTVGVRLPVWTPAAPRPAAARSRGPARDPATTHVVLPSCMARAMGAPRGACATNGGAGTATTIASADARGTSGAGSASSADANSASARRANGANANANGANDASANANGANGASASGATRRGDEAREGTSLADGLVELARRAGLHAWTPPDAGGTCCGLPFTSKGFPEAASVAVTRLVDRAWSWTDRGRLPLVVDASSCVHALRGAHGLLDARARGRWRRLRIVDAATWLEREVLRRAPIRKVEGAVAVHATCGSRKLGSDVALLAAARRCADTAELAPALACCGAAGDRALVVPELGASSLEAERAGLAARSWGALVADNPACELGLRAATGQPFDSIVRLALRATSPASARGPEAPA